LMDYCLDVLMVDLMVGLTDIVMESWMVV